jgi:hypothetical protein
MEKGNNRRIFRRCSYRITQCIVAAYGEINVNNRKRYNGSDLLRINLIKSVQNCIPEIINLIKSRIFLYKCDLTGSVSATDMFQKNAELDICLVMLQNTKLLGLAAFQLQVMPLRYTDRLE